MFIVSLTYKKQLEEVDNHIDAHTEYLTTQYKKGNFIASGRKIPRTGGIILSNMKTREQLEAVLTEDPFHKCAIAAYEITEFIPSMVGEGFEILKQQ